jgi:UDP-GlcNAc:undecaprenyl-phosphate GlcNAc-1-phosphate transferase
LDPIHGIAIVLVAACVAAVTTPMVIRFARRIGAIDRPNERKVSRRVEMPLLGGLAVAIGCTVGLATVFAGPAPIAISSQIGAFGVGSLLLLCVGVWDDRFDLQATSKFFVQIAAAMIAIHGGFSVDLFSDPMTSKTYDVPTWIMWPVSLVWIVGVTNAMNLIDGLDGLSAGIGAIIAATLTVICWQAEQWVGVAIGLALFGALVGYLPFNFPPARIFLGDTGSLFIGYSLALVALEGYRKTALLAFIVPILALAIPILDTLLSIVRRLRSGRGVFSPDRLHMHHRLLHREGSHRSAVLMLYFLTSCFCMIAVSFSQLDGWLAFVYLAAVVAVTVRLLRNLDAFSLDLSSDDRKSTDEREFDERGAAEGDGAR